MLFLISLSRFLFVVAVVVFDGVDVFGCKSWFRIFPLFDLYVVVVLFSGLLGFLKAGDVVAS